MTSTTLKRMLKYGSKVVDGINGGEAQDYDNIAEAQQIGAALASLLNR